MSENVSFVDKTAERLGLGVFVSSGFDKIKQIMSTPVEEFAGWQLKDLQNALWLLSQYSCFLRSEISRARARKCAAESFMRVNVYSAAANYEALSLDERKALAISGDKELLRVDNLICKQSVIIEMAVPVLEGLDKLSYRLETFIRGKHE